MTHVMTKPCPVCKQQITKRQPTDTVLCTCGKHVWRASTFCAARISSSFRKTKATATAKEGDDDDDTTDGYSE